MTFGLEISRAIIANELILVKSYEAYVCQVFKVLIVVPECGVITIGFEASHFVQNAHVCVVVV